MTVETFTPSKTLITLTPSAIAHFESALEHKPNMLIRLSTKVSGCTGYAYVLDFAASAAESDELVKINPKLTVAVAKDAVSLVRNTEIDYVKEGINGVIKYNNPNVANECGCGESFNVG